ncbi:hypothetical protein JI435_159350 [Parastagonospora nodorum SN15]|uniref:Uncharacterized protein n=1 Tax=Phaeosphaeria nodorum (strain SN15 / ATCC MYA-4574 / FGSC 10173) TaxID=321614 RepID=A0A7U2EZU4_PHANO|nr:hypothetical protein JI435_159350 [Parastagonospora nodorum SN15]
MPVLQKSDETFDNWNVALADDRVLPKLSNPMTHHGQNLSA